LEYKLENDKPAGQLKKLKIKRLKAGMVKTKFGDKQTINICVAGPKGDFWINGFASQGNAAWKEGDEVEILVTSKKVNDKIYFNYRLPSNAVTRTEFDDLKRRVINIEIRMGLDKVKQAFDSEEVDKEGIPF
jgi:hypothetical protein